MNKYPEISDDPAVQKRYVELRKGGQSHAFAELLAFAKPPRYINKYSPMHPRRNRGRGY